MVDGDIGQGKVARNLILVENMILQPHHSDNTYICQQCIISKGYTGAFIY
jgi:hypothetical protein